MRRDSRFGPALLALILVSSTGCAHYAQLSQLPAEEQAKYKGTEPGRHVLSPYFAVEIKENSWATFYHYRDPQDPKTRETIGGAYMFWPSLPTWAGRVNRFGPRPNAYAVSEDGRSLLYFREPKVSAFRSLFEERPRSFPADLHLYRHGLGDSLIIAGVSHFRSGPEAPSDAVIYAVPDRRSYVSEPIVRSIAEFDPR